LQRIARSEILRGALIDVHESDRFIVGQIAEKIKIMQ